jgi:PAS domain S-box-containing protein
VTISTTGANLRTKTFEHVPLGVIQVDAHRVITYANRAMQELAGGDSLVGRDIFSLVDDAGENRLSVEIQKRFDEIEGSQYTVNLIRPATGQHIPVSVSAAPDFDGEGRVVGSLAFVRDLRLEVANAEVHAAIQRESEPGGLLRRLSSIIGKRIPFDACSVWIVSEKRTHLMMLFPESTGEGPNRSTVMRWWPMPPISLEFLDRHSVHNLDVALWLTDPRAQKLAEEDEDTRRWLDLGYKHVLVRPVLREGNVVAFLTLERRGTQPFGKREFEIIEHLPVAEAVLTSLQIVRRKQLEFAIDLIGRIGEAADNIPAVAEILVNELKGHYGWEHVSLFQVDEDIGRFRLLSQANCEGMSLEPGLTVPFTEGLLARVLATHAAVNVGDVASLEPGEYVIGISKTVSEMCLPIPGKKLRWILNVESRKKLAFADDEQKFIEFLAREAGFILERAALLGLKSAILASIEDAVLQTNSAGIISDANPAACAMFDLDESKIVGSEVARFISDEFVRKRILTVSDSPRAEIELVKNGGKKFPALLSVSRLPEEIGGRVYVASDLTYQKRVEQTELLKTVFQQVALETRTPLALASTWVRRAQTNPEEESELLEKTLGQLKKMDITLERVMRIAGAVEARRASCAPTDLKKLLDRLLGELPSTDTQQVRLHFDQDLPFVLSDERDLEFCVGNMFNVLQRAKPRDQEMAVVARKERKSVLLGLKFASPERSPSVLQNAELDRGVESLADQLWLGESIVEQTLERMGAALEGSVKTGYLIRLPVAQA